MSAKHAGSGHFIAQRVSALVLLVLAPWFVLTAALTMPAPSFVGAIDFLSAPLNAVLVILLAAASLYHMRLGMQAVIEDYIGRASTRMLCAVLNTLAPLALIAAAVFAMLQINFGG